MSKFKNYKKIIVAASLIALIFSVTAPNCFAATSIFQKMTGGLNKAVTEAYGGGEEVKITPATFSRGLVFIINQLLTFVAIVFFLGLIYAGWLWMTARGKEEQIDKAKKITREVVIALLIIFTARLLTELILTIIGQATI